MLQRRLVLWLFPVALLLGQLAGLAHGLTHALPDGPGKERVTGAFLCDQCASFAKVTSVAADSPLPAAATRLLPVTRDETSPGHRGRVAVPYQSRAPPILC
jgi:hypothetical protein